MEGAKYKYRYRLNAYEVKNVAGRAMYTAERRHIPFYLSSGVLRRGDFTLLNARQWNTVTSTFIDPIVASGTMGVESVPNGVEVNNSVRMDNTGTRDFSFSGTIGNTSLNGSSWDLMDKINLELIDLTLFTRNEGPCEIPELAGTSRTTWVYVYEVLE